MSIKITTLIENNKYENSSLINEHGLSLFIEVDKTKIIFDSGQSDNFIKNAYNLNVDFKKADYVILSHNHYDHTGGFISLIKEINYGSELIIKEEFFYEKYAYKDQLYCYNGASFNEGFIEENKIAANYIKEDVYNLTDKILIFSNFKRKTDFETINEKFNVKLKGVYEKDLFIDEIVLGIKVKEGLLVVLGCSHVGVVNILETIAQRTGLNIYGVIGGTHLVDADEERLNKTIEYFIEKDIKLIAVSHCTGDIAINKLKDQLKDRFILNNTGSVIEII